MKNGSIAVDVTAGGGGHAAELLKQVGKDGLVVAFDKDTRAIEHLTKKFHSELESGNLILVHDHFDTIKKHIERLNLTGKVNAICATLVFLALK